MTRPGFYMPVCFLQFPPRLRAGVKHFLSSKKKVHRKKYLAAALELRTTTTVGTAMSKPIRKIGLIEQFIFEGITCYYKSL